MDLLAIPLILHTPRNKNISIFIRNKLNNVDNTKENIIKNKPIEDKLHIIAVVSNQCNYKIRYKLTNDIMKRMETEPVSVNKVSG